MSLVLHPQTTNKNRDEVAESSSAGSTESIPYIVNIRYLNRSPLLVRGAVTGRNYLFSSAQPILAVDKRDLEDLLKIGVFREV